jgi:hypothetical protein
MDLASLAGEPTPFETPRGTLLATPGSMRQVARIQGWLNRQKRPGDWPTPPKLDLNAPPDPSLPPEMRKALAEQRIAAARGQKPDDGWPPDLFDDAQAAFRLIIDSDEGTGLVLSSAFGRNHPEYADPKAAVALADDLSFLQGLRAYMLALGMPMKDDDGPNPEAPPEGDSASGGGPTTSTSPSTSPSDTPGTPSSPPSTSGATSSGP